MVNLLSTVTYSGSQGLRIDGSGSKLDGSATGGTAFASTGGGNLELHDMTIQNSPGTGIFIDVPAGRSGRLTVELSRATIRNNGLYGLHVDDRADGAFGGADSAAIIVLDVEYSRIENNNADLTPGVFDLDGLRVDEGGDGDIIASVRHSKFTGNLADGLELDEAGPGDAKLVVRHSHFDGNGAQPQNTDDPEDGLDVDEVGPGSIYVDVSKTTSRTTSMTASISTRMARAPTLFHRRSRCRTASLQTLLQPCASAPG